MNHFVQENIPQLSRNPKISPAQNENIQLEEFLNSFVHQNLLIQDEYPKYSEDEEYREILHSYALSAHQLLSDVQIEILALEFKRLSESEK